MELQPYDELMSGLRKKRRRLEITQRELANRAGISKSLLSQMEHGKKDAKYTTVYSIWEHLNHMEQKQAETAEELMNTPIVSVSPDDTVEQVQQVMRKNDFSQLPVHDNGEMVGSINEAHLMDVSDADTQVASVMSEPFETISPGTGRDAIIELLKDGNNALIVKESDAPEGIITKSDLL